MARCISALYRVFIDVIQDLLNTVGIFSGYICEGIETQCSRWFSGMQLDYVGLRIKRSLPVNHNRPRPFATAINFQRGRKSYFSEAKKLILFIFVANSLINGPSTFRHRASEIIRQGINCDNSEKH